MSRTIRRRSGDRWFAEKQRDWKQTGKIISTYEGSTWDRKLRCFLPFTSFWFETIEVTREFDKKLEAEWTRDKYLSNPCSQDLKQESNKVSRADQRQQLQLIMRGQEHYDDSYELSVIKGLAWIYD